MRPTASAARAPVSHVPSLASAACRSKPGLCAQDVSGGQPVLVRGEQSGLLWGMEMDTAAAAAELRGLGKDDNAERINGFLSSIGLGAFADQLKDLQLGAPAAPAPSLQRRRAPLRPAQHPRRVAARQIAQAAAGRQRRLHQTRFATTPLTEGWVGAGELLDTLPPGVDELVAISNVVRFIRSPEYAHFTRIVFDTAPTGTRCACSAPQTSWTPRWARPRAAPGMLRGTPFPAGACACAQRCWLHPTARACHQSWLELAPWPATRA